jgi:hypothetical protein
MRAGLRYMLHAPQLQAILIRAFFFTFFASAVWALLAVVAQQYLHKGAMGYGILNGCLGLGAVIGASALPRMRRRFLSETLVLASAAIFASTLGILAFARNVPIIVIVLISAGFAWTCTTSSLNVAVQLSTPAWVQARALGIYQMIFQGGMALGSAIWGFTAERSSTSNALLAAGIGLFACAPVLRRYPLLHGTLPDLSPYALNRPAPQVVIEPHPEDGPVLLTIEYRIRPEDYDAFTRAVHAMRDVRMRDGAIRWGIFQNAVHPERLTETFVVESWIEYLRQRERMTASDSAIRDRVWSFHQGGPQPAISYMIYAREIAH